MLKEKPRKYHRPTKETWDKATELHHQGRTYAEIAEVLKVSVRSVATNLPKALERRAKSLSGAALDPKKDLPNIPEITDRKAATKHWRAKGWEDLQLVQARLRQEVSKPSPDTRAIRALSTGAEALRNLIRIGGDLLEIDKYPADQVLPELIIRDLTEEEVTALRTKQRSENSSLLDDDEIEAISKGASSTKAEERDATIVIEERA